MAQQQNPAPEQPEGDALDELENALGQEDVGTGEGEGGEWTPPTREEWEAQQTSLKAEQAKLKRAREQAKRLREGKPPAPAAAGEGAEGAPPAGPDPQLAVWRARAVKASAASLLKDRGVDAALVPLALGQLDATQVGFDARDQPELEDWLDELEESYPSLFAKPEAPAEHARRPAGRVDQGRAASGQPVAVKKRFGEQVLENARRTRR